MVELIFVVKIWEFDLCFYYFCIEGYLRVELELLLKKEF